MLHQVPKPRGHVVSRGIAMQYVEELPVRIDEVKAAVIDEIVVAAARMGRQIDVVFLGDGGDLILRAGQRNDVRIERIEIFGEAPPASRFGSTVMKTGCNAAASSPSLSSATPMLLSAVGQASGQEGVPEINQQPLAR
jgi:hypothetical protein